MKIKIISAIILLLALASCYNVNKSFTKEEVIVNSKKLGFSEKDLYFIKDEFRKEMLAKGQPNSVVFDKKVKVLKIGTCYEEYPFFMDEFFNVKSQLTDTLQMYDLEREVDVAYLFSQIEPHSESEMELDSTKKYYHFYYFADYAKKMDAKLKPALQKYQDSVQYFFINIDKIK